MTTRVGETKLTLAGLEATGICQINRLNTLAFRKIIEQQKLEQGDQQSDDSEHEAPTPLDQKSTADQNKGFLTKLFTKKQV